MGVLLIFRCLVNFPANGSLTVKGSIRHSNLCTSLVPFEAVEQTTVFDDFTFQRDFDFGA